MRKKDSTLSNEVLENLNSKFSENHPYRRSFSGFTFQFQFSVALGDDMFYDRPSPVPPVDLERLLSTR